MPKEFYSTTEVSHILKISRISVFNRIKSGKIRAVKIGRNYIIDQESLLEALGEKIGPHKKQEIDKAIDKAIKEYGEVFKRLGKE